MKISVTYIVLSVVALLAIGEGIARFGLGLGDPPLSEGSSDIDYIFKANQRCRRFGNRIWYNNYSMRVDFDISHAFAGRRLFVVGDSIVNGGSLTDQDQLATALLQRWLPSWQVCHVSAGSWGPGNYAAYFRRFPELVRTNDILVVQVSSHDLWEDDPREGGGRIVGVDRAFPERKPFCALWDGCLRYAWPRFCAWLKVDLGGKGEEGARDAVGKVRAQHECEERQNEQAKYNLACCEELFRMPFARRCLYVHRDHIECQRDEVPVGESAFVDCAHRHGVTIIRSSTSPSDYRDFIHLNADGQRKMAEAIYHELERMGDVK